MAVADYFGAVATAVAATASTGGPANWQLSGVVDGRVKCMIDSYTALGTETAGKVIAMGPVLPTGANVLAIILTASVSKGSLTMSIGDYASPTRYKSATTDVATAGTYFYGGKGYVIGTAANATVITSDNQILLTTAGATLDAATVYTVIVLYTLD